MTELSGTLDGVGLPAIVRFLIGLDRTGCLRVSQHDWQGQIYFQAGRVIGASLGSRTGLPALDALTESLPAATFVFDSQPPTMPVPNIRIGRDALLAHLDDLATRVASGERTLPTVDAVPLLVASADADDGDDPVPVDRGELQTLLAVDGRRTARDIVAERGTFDALWQLRDLMQAGLVRLAETPRPVGVAAAPRGPAGERHLMDIPLDQAQPLERASRCPKLGFQDDPAHAFERPTRLHRCFAAGTPLPLSLDQQRELCLSEQFGTCPRLTSNANHGGRILRLPFVARVNAGRS
ncbi:MAG TPA: DUF4388 domain-containing protein, partial [Chloroflexota bacterium]